MSAQLSESSSSSSWWAAWLLSQLPLTHCPPTLDLQGLPFKVPTGMLEAGPLIKCPWEKTEVGGRRRQGGKIMEGRVRAIGKKEDWVMKWKARKRFSTVRNYVLRTCLIENQGKTIIFLLRHS